jgi:hypothetical protein
MRRAAAPCLLLLLATATTANAQLAATKFYNLTDTPASITYSASGSATIVLEPGTGGTTDLTGYRKVCFRIGTAKATTFAVTMGKISNATLAAQFTGTIDNKIHTYDVIGPQMTLRLTNGPANTADTVQVWVYLTS